jgi:hypothetical protein
MRKSAASGVTTSQITYRSLAKSIDAPGNSKEKIMRFRVLPFVLSFAFAAALTSAKTIECPGGEPPKNATEPIQYTFPECKAGYTQDEQHALCPLLGAYLQDNTGDWVEVPVGVESISVESEGAKGEAVVTFPFYGRYELILSYTPFVYSAVEVNVSSQGEKRLVTFNPEKLRPWQGIAISPNDKMSATGTLEVSFPNAIDSVDPYTVDAEVPKPLVGPGAQWALRINCTMSNKVSVFVADPRGCFDNTVDFQASGLNIQLGGCGDYWKGVK